MNERRTAAASTGGLSLRWRDESGKNSIRGVIALLLIAGMVYAGIKFLPVRAAAYQFNDAIRDEVVFAGSRRSTDDQIMSDLLDRATILGLPIKRENITILRSGRKYIIIEANYTVVVDLLGGYQYEWDFRQRHEGPVF
jgi:hypothetical protein